MVAAMAAKHMNAPESIIFFETGAIDSALEEIPMAVADPRVMYSAASNEELLDAFIATIAETYHHRRRGSGRPAGAPSASSPSTSSAISNSYQQDPRLRRARRRHATWLPRARYIVFMQHEKESFPKVVPREPGYLDGNGGRAGRLISGSTTIMT